MKVQIGKLYLYDPIPMDASVPPPYNLMVPGDVVKVIKYKCLCTAGKEHCHVSCHAREQTNAAIYCKSLKPLTGRVFDLFDISPYLEVSK